MTRLTDHLSDYEDARSSVELVQEGIAYKLGNAICSTCFVSLEESHPSVDFSEYGLDLDGHCLVLNLFGWRSTVECLIRPFMIIVVSEPS